jgi:hypothetical protein
MAIIKSYSPYLNLSNFSTFIVDRNPNSDYFRINEFKEVFSGGKNGFLIAGSEFLKETTEVKIEILDVEGNPIYFEPGDGTPEYYEGLSTLVSVHVYPDTPIGLGKITILGELKNYVNQDGTILPIPEEWKGVYNVKWERTFNINRNLANEDIVRFYRRPSVTITELVKPIFSKTIPSVTQSGSVEGIAIQPIQNANLSNWTAGTLYKLKITDGTNWTSSIDDNIIDIPSLGYSPTVIEVLNNKEVLVDVPYAENNIVKNFSSTSYTSSFEYVEGQTVTTSILTGSFAKINISNLKTFVGDVARVKVFRKSRNEVTDYQFVQESKLESSELLRDITVSSDTEISYGNFNQTNLSTYWTSSNSNHPLSINVDVLQSSVKCDYNTLSGSVQNLITTESFSISKDVEYTLTFKTLLSGSIDGSEYIKAYFSSSDGYQQTFLTISGSSIYKTRQNVSQNIIASPISTSDAKLVFEIKGSDWYISNVSLKNAQETSFSPDEFVLVQDIQRKLASETFDFKFEFYDINNNYIPVDVTATGIFDGGNEYPTNTKILLLQSDRSSFRFTTGSLANPPFQQIGFTTTRQNIVDDVTYSWAAFDITGSYINPNNYLASGGLDYPGRPHTSSSAGFVLQIDEFTGSLDTATTSSVRVGFIVYTASADGLEEYETIYRLEDGDNAPGIFASSTSNQFIYKATDLSLNPNNQVITFDVRRKNLGTSSAPITINSISSGSIHNLYHLSLSFDDPTTGVATYYLSGSNYKFTSGSTTFFFSASDGYGIDYHDQITITPIKILDGLSVNLTNENATLPARSNGFVESGSFLLSSGSVSVKVGNETIQHSNGLTSNNRFDVISATATSVITGSLDYSTTDYFITRLDADSGSLSLVVRYKDGAGDTTDVTKTISYSKNKKSAPVLDFLIGNNNQSTTAKSTGEQVDAFLTASFNVLETYNGTTTSKPLTITSVSASNSYVTGSTTSTTMALPNMANGTNSTDIQITGSVTDSENTLRNVFGNISLAKVKKAVPLVVISASPQAQSVLANASGTQTGTLTNVTISALEGTTSRFTSMTATYSGFSTNPTIATNSNILNTSAAIMNAAEASATIIVTHTDSEGTSGQTQTIVVRFTKVPTGQTGATGPSGSNGTNGNDGRRTATGQVYYQLTTGSAPDTPTATSYTFSTNTFGSLTSDWGVGAPTYAAGNTNKYWYSTFTAVETTPGGGTAVPTFSTPAQAINFTGLVTFTSTDRITDGSNTSTIVPSGSITNHIGGANVTTINGGRISTGVITSTGYTLGGSDTLASGSYTVSGTIFNLDNGSLRSKNFYIDSSGNANFKGNLTGASGTFGGSIKIGSGENVFIADTSGIYLGNETFANAEFSVTPAGALKATSGTIGGWSIGSTTLTGGNATLNSTGNITLGTSDNIIRLSADDTTYRLWIGNAVSGSAPFRVTKEGALTATGVTVGGTINATGGTFSGNITATGTISGGTLTGAIVNGSVITGGTGDFSGTITTNDGEIGGWKIEPGKLYSANNIINLISSGDGSITIKATGTTTPRIIINGGSNFASYGGLYSSGLQTYNSSLTSETLYGYTLKTTSNLFTLSTTAGKSYVVTATETQPNGDIAAESNSGTEIYMITNQYRLYVKNTTTNVETTILGDSANFYDGSGANGVQQALFGGNGYFSSATILGDGNSYEVYIESRLQINAQSAFISRWRHPSMTFQIDEVASYTELNGAGLQAGESSTKYIRVRRVASNEGNTSTTTMLEVGGAISCTGDVVANTSDKRLKTNIRKIDSALEKIEKINGVFFNWNEVAKQKVNKDDREEIGFLAQEIKEVLPQIVRPAPFDCEEDGTSKSGENYLTIQYDKIVPLLLEGIKELKKEIEELKKGK